MDHNLHKPWMNNCVKIIADRGKSKNRLKFLCFSEFQSHNTLQVHIIMTCALRSTIVLLTTNTFPLELLSMLVPFFGLTVLAYLARGILSRHISTTRTSSPSRAAIPQLHDTV